MSRSSISPNPHPTPQARFHTRVLRLIAFRTLLSNQAGSSSLEQSMVAALVVLGTTSVVGGAASFFATAAHSLVAMLSALLPA